MSTGDIVVDHVADIYGSQASKDLVTKVTDAVLVEDRPSSSTTLGTLRAVD